MWEKLLDQEGADKTTKYAISSTRSDMWLPYKSTSEGDGTTQGSSNWWDPIVMEEIICMEAIVVDGKLGNDIGKMDINDDFLKKLH